jgi:hypothetical protein
VLPHENKEHPVSGTESAPETEVNVEAEQVVVNTDEDGGGVDNVEAAEADDADTDVEDGE